MSDYEDDKVARERRKKRVSSRAKGRSNGGFFCPTSIVLSPTEAITQPGAIELGLLLMFLVGLLYFYGCYEAIESLPNTPRQPDWRAHLGENLNLALNEFDSTLTKTGKNPRAKQQGAEIATDGAVAYKITTADDVNVPECKWPVRLRDELDQYETIIHPGDLVTKMKIPPFWSPPIHKNGLMSRELAMKVGSCAEPDANGNYARGDACPIFKRTIFVQIASFRDFECRGTVEDIFLRSTYPDRIRVAVVDQIKSGEDPRCDEPPEPCDVKPEQALCKYKDRIDVYEMDADLSIGPVFARHIGYRMYRGEYYATQSDAHVSYINGWDVSIVQQLEATNDEMGVLSTYLTDVQGSIDKNGHSLVKTRPIMCNTIWEGGPQGMHLRHASQPEKFPVIHGMPQLAPWWAAGYSFSRGHFVVNVPYDWLSPMIFQGEEMSIGIRGFSIGYDYYSPERSVCFHHYAVGKNKKIRNRVKHFWDSATKYEGTGRKAMQRLLGIVHMNPEVDAKNWDHRDEEIYGIGGVREVQKFYEVFGIDVKKKTIERNMCSFVDGKAETSMHSIFHPHLRKDGMGVDYNRIHYKFVDPQKARMGSEKEQVSGGIAKAVSTDDGEGEESAADDTDEVAAEEEGIVKEEAPEAGNDDNEEAEEVTE
ncbi:hypothetical protein MPSEU_000372000 [Mayamaea pseudoterrestris]|nr:hypothetical protein MPSEU_000372000 [Mayamaea pseudoterrestris]